MVVQAANDPRKDRGDQIIVALRERKYPVEYILAPDEGCWISAPGQQHGDADLGRKILAKHLGGCDFRKAERAETVQRLKEITVDINTVTMPVKIDPNAKATVDVTRNWTMFKRRSGPNR
ncbi:MAG: hypothetical protein IPJ30_10010 [Acidobacteria bacterium]|nr:hypothetical protein [Acidobacteriota bacterium]